MKLNVKISPRSSRNEIVKHNDGSLKIFLTAAPVGGKANDAAVRELANYFNIGKTKIKLVRGRTGKNKIFEIII